MSNPIAGQPFESEEEKLLENMAQHWQQAWNEAPVQALARIEDAAKQMIVVTTGLQGLYVAIFAFSSIRAQAISALGSLAAWPLLFLFFAPLVCWLVSLWYATRVFVPRVRPDINLNELRTSAWQKIRDEYGQVNEQKLFWLHRSHRWLMGSFLLVLLAVLLFVFLPAAPTGPTQIIIVTPTPSVLPTPTP